MLKFTRAFILQIAGLVALVLALVVISRHLPVLETLTGLHHRIGQMEQWGLLLYPLLLALCNLLLLPGGVIAIGAGFFFGLWWGFFLVLLGNVVGAAIAFQFSRRLGRGWVEKKLFRHRKWVLLDEAIAREGWKIIVLSQVHPLFPTSLMNYVYGITRIRFRECMLWIAIGQAPGLFFYSYLGTLAQLGVKLLQGKTSPERVEYILWLGGALLTLAVTTALGRVALRILAQVEKAAEEKPVDHPL